MLPSRVTVSGYCAKRSTSARSLALKFDVNARNIGNRYATWRLDAGRRGRQTQLLLKTSRALLFLVAEEYTAIYSR